MLTVAVVIATYKRPGEVARCLDALELQTVAPDELVVVDASPDSATRDVVVKRPWVVYLRNEAGVGTTATSRAIGIANTTSDIVAFLDDDSVPSPAWLKSLLLPYADAVVGAVGGRVVNDAAEAASADPTNIGRLLPNGSLTGNFAADPGQDLRVSHLLGANMSYRRSAMDALGGIHEFYPGTGYREDSDMGLRMDQAGFDVVFAPSASVDHIAGQYSKGKRFDYRYMFYSQRNHIVLLSSVFGMRSSYLRRYLLIAAREIADDLRGGANSALSPIPASSSSRLRLLAGGVSRAGAKALGLVAGAKASIGLRVRLGPRPQSRSRT